MTNVDLSILFFLQLAVILAACRVVGALAPRVGQPPVVSEMVAGVVLGPSLFGALLPGWHATLFPKPSMTILFAVAQLGLAMYMFLVGVEFRADLIRPRVSTGSAADSPGPWEPCAPASVRDPSIRGPAHRAPTCCDRTCRSGSPCRASSHSP
jgi:hypothetical protein